jgi:DNA-binding transcriptional MerR regulator
MFLGGAILGVGVLVWDKRFRMIVSMAYKLAMRNLTGLFVQVDPIGILKEHLHKLDLDIENVNEQLNKVKGVIVGLRRKVEAYLAEYKQYMDLAQAAQKKNQATLAKSNSMFAERRKGASEKLATLHRKLEAIYRVLSKMYENSKIVRDQTADEIEMKESEWIAIRSASKAMRSAMSVINGNADERALYEQTLEFMATDVGNKIGEMERFLEVSQNVLAGIDLQQDVFSDKGLKELEEWGKTADSWILGDEKQKLLAAAADDSNIATIEGPPVDTNYAEMFKKL